MKTVPVKNISKEKFESLLDLAIQCFCDNQLYEVNEMERIVPKIKNPILVPSELAEKMITYLRTRRVLTLDILELFNKCDFKSINLMMDFTNASPFQGPINNKKALTSAGSIAVLQSRVDDSWITSICENHPNLDYLDLTKCYKITDNGVRTILSKLTNLKSLSLAKAKYTTTAAYKDLSLLTNLETLFVTATKVGGESVTPYLTSLKNLTAFDTSSTRADDTAMFNLTSLTTLKILSIEATNVSKAGFQAITDNLISLERLNISLDTRINNFEGLKKLVNLVYLEMGLIASVDDEVIMSLSCLKNLEMLSVRSTSITNAALEYISVFNKLEILDISNNNIGFNEQPNQCLKPLEALTELKLLYVSYTSINNQDVEILSTFKNLRALKMSYCPFVTDFGISFLTNLPELLSLAIGPTITNECLSYLKKLSNLQTLLLWETKVTHSELLNILDYLPNLSSMDDRILTTGGTFIFEPIEEISPH